MPVRIFVIVKNLNGPVVVAARKGGQADVYDPPTSTKTFIAITLSTVSAAIFEFVSFVTGNRV